MLVDKLPFRLTRDESWDLLSREEGIRSLFFWQVGENQKKKYTSYKSFNFYTRVIANRKDKHEYWSNQFYNFYIDPSHQL